MEAEIVYRERAHGRLVEHTVKGTLGKPNHIGWVPIIVRGKKVADPHWTDIKGYYPERGGGYF